MHAWGAPAGVCETRIQLCGGEYVPWWTARDARGTGLDPSGRAIGSSSTAFAARCMAREPFGTASSSSASDEGLNETGVHRSGSVMGTR